MLVNNVKNILCILTLLIVCSFLAHSKLVAQNSRLDSLKKSLLQASLDTVRIDALLELSFGSYQTDVVKCREYAEQALGISQILNDTIRLINSYNCLGIASDLEGHSAQAISFWEKCLRLSEETNFLTGKMKSLNNLGIAHKEKGNTEKSLQFFIEALEIDDVTGNIKQSINTLSNIGYLYLSINDMDRAFAYLQDAIDKGEKLGDPSVLSHPFQRMGEYYVKKNDYEAALPFLERSLVICKQFAHTLRSTTVLRLKGECYSNLGLEERALEVFFEADQMLKKIGEKYTEQYTLYHTWAMAYSKQGDYKNAFAMANMGYDLAKDNNLESSTYSSLQLLGTLNEKIGNFKEALFFHKAASDFQDSLQLRTKEQLLIEVETKYQSDKKEIENQLLRNQKEKTEAELRNANIIMAAIVSVLSLLGIVLFLLFRAFRSKQEYNEELQKRVTERTKDLRNSNYQLKKSNAELEKFAFIASHDLKTPLRNIISFTGLLEQHLGEGQDQKVKEYFSFLKEGGKRMNSLIEDVLKFSKSIIDGEVVNEKIDLNLLCKELKSTLYNTIANQNATIEIVKPLPVVLSNYSSFFIVFQNLIENGIKYNQSTNPTVSIYPVTKTDSFSIFFEDNGIGIPKEYYNQIWVMFARLHTHAEYEGTGLGLATCKKIIEDLHGTIEVSSEVGKGSIFELNFPNSYLIDD